MPQINLSVINDNVKIGNIVKTTSDYVMVEYLADEVEERSDDIIEELITLLSMGMDVDLFDSDGNFYLDSDQIIRTRVGLLKS